MATPSNPSRNSSVKVNHSNGLKNVLLSNAAYGHQVFPRISSSEGLKIVLPAPAAPSSAFDGLVNAPSAAASTSTESSSGMEHPPYHVFISHHGGDTKRTIAKSIYNKLVATGLKVFLDQDEGVLEEAMASASLHIAIFSENYAHSPWCLDELVFILHLPNIKFIPIFYRVEPFTLGWAVENYADAFKEHERKGRFSLEKLQSWKSALRKASYYKGEKISNQREEEKAVNNVVNLVLKELKKVRIDVAKHPVGLDEAEQDFNNTLLHSAAWEVQMVGIWGMGGAGKTTLAKHLFNKKSLTFNGRSCFVSDVREAARKDALYDKQKGLLMDLDLETKDFDNVDKGKEILRGRLKSVPVLIVLDDVDHRDQLDALVPDKDSLGKGSLIIVTTRELRVLKAWGISVIYNIRALNAAHAKELFCWHAFGQPSPLLGFKELAEKFINACHGLPLSLKVFGGLLCGEYSKNYWQSQLDKAYRIVPHDIKSRLRISYDALDEEEREMFLDVACFFVGGRSSRAIALWDGSDWNGLYGLQRLVSKCLVELGMDDDIRMHDHLRDLGREIANQHSPYRLWSKTQIIKIQSQQERIRVRGMANAIGCNCYLREGKIILNTRQGERILEPGSLGLKILFDEGYLINERFSEIARELLFLRCDRFEHERFPSLLSLKKLRVLELINLQRLEKINDLKCLRSLEMLKIDNCSELDGLPNLDKLTSLKEFELMKCPKFQSIEGLESLKSLETLRIDVYPKWNVIPSQVVELICQKKIEMNRNKDNCTELDGLPSLCRINFSED